MQSLYNEESFDISKSERLSFITGDKGPSRIRKFEDQTGARIRIIDNTTIKISGNPSQRQEAKILVRDALEATSFIPTISYYVLSESCASNDKLKFVKFDEKTAENNDNSYSYESNGKSRYSVEILRQNKESDEIDEITYGLDDHLHVTPRQFNTFDKLDECLDRLSLKLQANFKKNSKASSLFSERIILKPRIFLGKVLFSQINNPEDSFSLREWHNFNVLSGRGRRGSVSNDNENYNSINVNVEFQQDSPYIYDGFKTLQRKYGFKWDDKQKNSKGSVYIYYTPSTNKKRKLKLRWNEEENKWKIVNHSHGLDRFANIDVISGSKAPDFRLSLKTHYDIPSEDSKVQEVIDDIQSTLTYERDGMWFRSKDFENTLIKRAVVRQVCEKKRFSNGELLITFSTIRHDSSGDDISIQNLITLKHHTWVQKLELSDSENFMNDVPDTISYVRDMMKVFT